jgi:transcriptional regulator with XRE-family HTH domain
MVNTTTRTTTGTTTTTGVTGQPGSIARAGGSDRRWTIRSYEPDATEREHLAAGVGRLLRDERTGVGLSLRRLAAEAGVSMGMLSMLERGLRRPRPATLAALAAVLAPDAADELTARLAAAAGPSLRPDTEAATRARRRRARRAGRRRYEAWRTAVELDRAGRERLTQSTTALNWQLLHAADRPDATLELVEAAERALLAALQESKAARAMQDEAARRFRHLRQLPARTTHPRTPAA